MPSRAWHPHQDQHEDRALRAARVAHCLGFDHRLRCGQPQRRPKDPGEQGVSATVRNTPRDIAFYFLCGDVPERYPCPLHASEAKVVAGWCARSPRCVLSGGGCHRDAQGSALLKRRSRSRPRSANRTSPLSHQRHLLTLCKERELGRYEEREPAAPRRRVQTSGNKRIFVENTVCSYDSMESQ